MRSRSWCLILWLGTRSGRISLPFCMIGWRITTFYGLLSLAGDTPLLHAAQQGQTATAKYLIEHGIILWISASNVKLIRLVLPVRSALLLGGQHTDFSGPTSGSTACVAIIRNNQVVVANAGDSRCVISRKGQAYNLSRDHKPELEVEKERILKAGGFIHAGRVNGSLNLARAIGDMEFKQNKFLPAEKQIVTANPDINIVEICDDDDFIVLACDGIWDCMSSQQLVDFIHEQLNLESKLSAICERVLDRCLAPSTAGGEGCDNMTMILVQFKKPIKSVGSAAEEASASKRVDFGSISHKGESSS